ncbi:MULTISPECIES: hypothetical protein [unclassified Campylobacter]|uniref:Uncharacterized protein n=1 Tax=Campylobacter suis TaxID=2790657 RepID=A0ABN7K6W6_9BACT|nr:hypothetical protein LMG8286_01179 [Campylobacter suis]
MKFVNKCEKNENFIHALNNQIKGVKADFHFFNKPTITTKRNLKTNGEKI